MSTFKAGNLQIAAVVVAVVIAVVLVPLNLFQAGQIARANMAYRLLKPPTTRGGVGACVLEYDMKCDLIENYNHTLMCSLKLLLA